MSLARLAILVSSPLVLALSGGCSAHVTSGSDPATQGTGGEGGSATATGNGGEGGSHVCATYEGAGCKPNDERSCICAGIPDSIPGENVGTERCQVVDGCTTAWDTYCECDTPLVLSFDGAPVEYMTDREHGFDLNGTRSHLTDWPTARTPWLGLDRDSNGSIDDGSELFGSMTALSSGRRARNGFEALAELDADGDGRITAADPAFAKLLVWADRDGDRRSSASELAGASSWELVSIDLRYTSEPRCDARDNCEVERASFTWRDASGATHTGAVVDVHLASQR